MRMRMRKYCTLLSPGSSIRWICTNILSVIHCPPSTQQHFLLFECCFCVFFSSFILLLISRTMTFNIAFNPQHSLIRRRQTGEKKTLRSRRRINKNRKSNAYPDAKHSIYKYIYRNRGSDVCQLALPCNSVCFGMLSFDDNSFRLFSIECRDCSTELLRVEWTKKTHRNLRRHTKKNIKKSINSCFLIVAHIT